MEQEPPVSNPVLETELHFECLWFEFAWAELEEWAKTAVPSAKQDRVLHNLVSWELINRLLVHGARIKRLLEPGDRTRFDSDESWRERTRFAAEMARRINPKVLNSSALGGARNSVEHANTDLAKFAMRHGDEKIGPFSIIWGSDPIDGAGGGRYFRWYRHSSGECRVYGKPVNLRGALESVREIRKCAHPHVYGELRESIPVLKDGVWSFITVGSDDAGTDS